MDERASPALTLWGKRGVRFRVTGVRSQVQAVCNDVTAAASVGL